MTRWAFSKNIMKLTNEVLEIPKMNENGTTRKYEQAKSNLAKALANQSAEHRADVLQYVVDWGVDPNEEFFLIFAAIGHLKVLIENAPQEWQEQFDSLYKNLDLWTAKQAILDKTRETNFTKLAEALKLSAQSSTQLSASLNNQAGTWTEQSTIVKSALETLQPWTEAKAELKAQIKTAVEAAIEPYLSEQKLLVENLKAQRLSFSSQYWRVAVVSALSTAVMVPAVWFAATGLGIFHLSLSDSLTSKINNGYTKLQRIESHLGVKSR